MLWGCSIEPTIVQGKKIQEDLLRYNAVVARESITYQAVRVFHPNTILAPDPAFRMPDAACKLDARWHRGT